MMSKIFLLSHVTIIFLLITSCFFGSFIAVFLIPFLLSAVIPKFKNARLFKIVSFVLSVLFLIYPGTIIFDKSDQGFKIKILPVIYGYPSPALSEKCEKDKVILGGCVVNPLMPQWAVVFYMKKGGAQ
jgi:hypothetical protein